MNRHRGIAGLLLIALLAGLLAGCAASGANTPAEPSPAEAQLVTQEPAPNTPAVTPPADIVARVNGQPIGRQEFERQVARFEAAMIGQGHDFSGEAGKELDQQIRRQVLEAMIDEMLIAQAAQAAGVTVTDEVIQQRIQNDIAAVGSEEAFRAWLTQNGMTMEEYQAMTRSTIITEEMVRRLANTLPQTMPQVHVRQILVATEAEAQALRQQLEAGADFAELARAHSLDESTRGQGGDLGFVPLGEGVLLPAVEEAVKGLSAGQIAGPIASPYGYYLVQVVEAVSEREVPAEVRQGLTQAHFQKWIEELRSKAQIERFLEAQ
jgi:parvulin-like peptidyl-prolyl isomerase